MLYNFLFYTITNSFPILANTNQNFAVHAVVLYEEVLKIDDNLYLKISCLGSLVTFSD